MHTPKPPVMNARAMQVSSAGHLKKLISAHNVGHGGGGGADGAAAPSACEAPSGGGCGHCSSAGACDFE